MSFRAIIATGGTTLRSIPLATHLGSPIPNGTTEAALQLAGFRQRRERDFQEMYKRRLAPVAGYNCLGQVFANRRTALYDDIDFARIVWEDGMAEVLLGDATIGDIVVYRIADRPEATAPHHVARIIGFERLALISGSVIERDLPERIPVVLSKFDDVSGEYEHRMDDTRWSPNQDLSRTVYRERVRAPRAP